jgi:lincosamide nucleotidyltransferase A/C/D/E
MAEVTAEDAVALLDLMEGAGATVWVDGGWGVDALLREQTRPHADLDIVVSEVDVAAILNGLERRGFGRIATKDEKPWNFVLRDSQGREVDVHVVALDKAGNGIYGPIENGDMYPSDSLSGVGEIGGRSVRCISPEWQLHFRTGYDWDDDVRDVAAIADRFGIEAPTDPPKGGS